MFAKSTIMASAAAICAFSYCVTDALDLATASFNLNISVFVLSDWTTFIARIAETENIAAEFCTLSFSSDVLSSTTTYAVTSMYAAIVSGLAACAA